MRTSRTMKQGTLKKPLVEKEGIQGEYPFVLFYEEVTDRELNKVLKALEQIPNEKERDDAMQIVLKAASESITLERIKKISSFIIPEQVYKIDRAAFAGSGIQQITIPNTVTWLGEGIFSGCAELGIQTAFFGAAGKRRAAVLS